MRTIFLVKDDEIATARAMEKHLLSLSKQAGILFVGIDVVQDPFKKERSVLYKVFVGCIRERDPKLMDAIVKRYLRDYVPEYQLAVEARRGFAREDNLS